MLNKNHFTESDCQLLENIIGSRRDVRGSRFIKKPVTDAIVERLIKAALQAPSVGFSQPWQFVIIRSDATKQRVYQSFLKSKQKEAEHFTGDKKAQYQQLKLEGIVEAPVNIAVFYQPAQKPILGQSQMSNSGRYSVVCAIQNLWLMARSLNVGVGWVSIVEPEQVKQAVNANHEAELIGYLCIGYVDKFLDIPELEQKGWEKKKQRQQVVFNECF